MGLRIDNGKIYDGDKVIRPEIGNLSHINLVKEEVRRLEELEGGIPLDIEVDVRYEGSSYIRCKCESFVYFMVETDYEDDIEDEFVGLTKTCNKCKTKFKIVKSNGGILAIIIKDESNIN